MIAKASHQIKQINDLVKELQNIKNPDLDAKKKQINAVAETIEKLKGSGVTVPQELVTIQNQLNSELKELDNPDEILLFIADELSKTVEEIKRNISVPSRTHLKNYNYKGRIDPTIPVTDSETLKEALLLVLKELGGSSNIDTILQKMEIKLKNRLTPADKDFVGYGVERWKNKAMWVRFHLIKQGILKKKSPRGIWELSENYMKKN